MRFESVACAAPMRRLETTTEDWAAFDPADLRRTVTLLLVARRFEEAVFALDRRGLVHGPAHSSIGQEDAAAGCVAALPRGALINGTHRAYHQAVAKLVHALYEEGFDPACANRPSEAMRREIRMMLADVLGLRESWSGGRGGSTHLRRDKLGIIGTNAIVGGGLPIACGAAWAEKARGTGRDRPAHALAPRSRLGAHRGIRRPHQ